MVSPGVFLEPHWPGIMGDIPNTSERPLVPWGQGVLLKGV